MTRPTKDEMQEMRDERDAPKLEKAYMDSLTSTEAAPKPESKKDPRDAVRGQRGYAKGGMTASKRADGIAQRGKTKGTMVMCGGGMARGKM